VTRRFAFDHLVALAADGQRGVQENSVAGHQAVKEMAETGQVLLTGGTEVFSFPSPSKVLTDVLGAIRTVPGLGVGPLQTGARRSGRLRVCSLRSSRRKTLGGEHGGLAGAVDDRRQLASEGRWEDEPDELAGGLRRGCHGREFNSK